MSSAELYIDLTNICSNWSALNILSNGSAAAVVKANAYGLGIKEVGISLAKAGARDFFVAIAEEGAELRRAIGEGPKIYVFSGHMVGDTSLIKSFDLIPLINSAEQLAFHAENSAAQSIGIQLDTGMNRLGMEGAEFEAIKDIIPEHRPARRLAPGHGVRPRQRHPRTPHRRRHGHPFRWASLNSCHLVEKATAERVASIAGRMPTTRWGVGPFSRDR